MGWKDRKVDCVYKQSLGLEMGPNKLYFKVTVKLNCAMEKYRTDLSGTWEG
jgi:hypothetical protein